MNIYVFGNIDEPHDNKSIIAAKKLTPDNPELTFIFIKPNEDVPFINEKKVIILDVIQGIDRVELIEDSDLDKLSLSPRGSVHDFDLAFQLKYLKKLGKLGEVFIIGIPLLGEIDYLRIQSILRKLVAQDIQGS